MSGGRDVRGRLPAALRARCTATSWASATSPADPWVAAPRRHRGRLPLLEQRPRPRLPRATRASPSPGHGRDRPGDGVRQPRRPTPGRASCSPATRRPARRVSTATSCSTPRARTSSPAPTRPSDVRILDERMPAVGAELRRYAATLERHYRDCCDIEFTIEQGRLWMLQVPGRQAQPAGGAAHGPRHGRGPGVPALAATRRSAASPASSPTRRRPSPSAIAMPGPRWPRACAASPGVACGEIVLTPEAAVAAAEAGRPGDPRARGDLARRRPRHEPGGRDPDRDRRARQPRRRRRARLGDPGRGRGVGRGARRRRRHHRRDACSAPGDTITIDGGTGEVFAGAAAGVAQVVSRRRRRSWAGPRELGIAIEVPRRRRTAHPAPTRSPTPSRDRVGRAEPPAARHRAR